MTKSGRHMVIMSGAYCSPEIVAEFGRMPPAFLPVGSRRLFERQIDLADMLDCRAALTIPADFQLASREEAIIAARGVQVIRTPISLNLAEALQLALEVIQAEGELFLLHGDTLVESADLDRLDTIATALTEEYYPWADVEKAGDRIVSLKTSYGDGLNKREVACGYFSFSDAMILRRALVGDKDFVTAINDYAAERPVQAVQVEQWYDFGHLPLIYQSKRNMLVSRAFNAMHSDGVSLTKTSRQKDKMAAEAAWYEALPPRLRAYTPKYLGQTEDAGEAGGYRLEYMYQPVLSELFVFGRLPSYVWRRILASCVSFLEECQAIAPVAGTPEAGKEFAAAFYASMIADKSRQRLAAFAASRGWDMDFAASLNGRKTPSLRQVVDDLIAMVPETTPSHVRFWHGDFFFGNTFYDFRASRIRTVDPRGMLGDGTLTRYGDWRYDAAKLAHSVYGRYDYLLAGMADLQAEGEGRWTFARPGGLPLDEIEHSFAAMTIGDHPVLSTEIKAICALLFLSMLPLHAENPRRQDMFLCNGLSMHRELTEGGTMKGTA